MVKQETHITIIVDTGRTIWRIMTIMGVEVASVDPSEIKAACIQTKTDIHEFKFIGKFN